MIETGVNQDAQIIRLSANSIAQLKVWRRALRANILFVVYLNISDYNRQDYSLKLSIEGGNFRNRDYRKEALTSLGDLRKARLLFIG